MYSKRGHSSKLKRQIFSPPLFFPNLRLKLYSFNVKKKKKKLINSCPSVGLFVEYLWFSKKHKYKLIIT